MFKTLKADDENQLIMVFPGSKIPILCPICYTRHRQGANEVNTNSMLSFSQCSCKLLFFAMIYVCKPIIHSCHSGASEAIASVYIWSCHCWDDARSLDGVWSR